MSTSVPGSMDLSMTLSPLLAAPPGCVPAGQGAAAGLAAVSTAFPGEGTGP